MRVLLVDADEAAGAVTRAQLIQERYIVDWVKNGQAALQALSSEAFDVVILELVLPRVSGLEVLRSVRNKGNLTPALILTAQAQSYVMALDAGADAFLDKPCGIAKLCATLRALARRTVGRANPLLTYARGDKIITLDPATRSVNLNGAAIEALHRREFDLLQMLLERQNKILPRTTIEQTLYGWQRSISSNAIEVHVFNLRKKFGKDFIDTVYGVGYVVKTVYHK